MDLQSDSYFMREALKQAFLALSQNEIPVGAVIVCNQSIISRAHNFTEKLTDVTAHAEMQAFTAASHAIGGKYLCDCTLFVTLEPCVMCAGAAYWTQIGRIVYGAKDPKRGFSLVSPNLLHPKTSLTQGVLQEECTQILTDFFKQKR
ncbi:MAG: nucleoside deaminase [Bacteroidales bacterium]